MRPQQKRAFTILEVMIAIGIFTMILISIYSIWSGILRATKAARSAGDAAQRGRIAVRTLEDALRTSQMFTAHMRPNPKRVPYYTFNAEPVGDYTALEFTAHLPANFPGVGRYGDSIVRRVRFVVVTNSLIMWQAPLVEWQQWRSENGNAYPEESDLGYLLTLANDVQFFIVEFWGKNRDTRADEWVSEWTNTNALPKQVRIGLGTGKGKRQGDAQDVVFRVIDLPAWAVAAEWQMPGAAGGALRGGRQVGEGNFQIPGGRLQR